MMRALAERHRGLLPLDTVEGIWRVIIATFTYVQAPFAVHADVSGGDAPMRDSARFHFGFTVPYRAAPERRRGDRGGGALARRPRHLPARPGRRRRARGGAASSATDGPKVIARLPFIERPDHPAGTPVFVVAKPLADAAVRDVILYSARFERWREPAREALGKARRRNHRQRRPRAGACRAARPAGRDGGCNRSESRPGRRGRPLRRGRGRQPRGAFSGVTGSQPCTHDQACVRAAPRHERGIDHAMKSFRHEARLQPMRFGRFSDIEGGAPLAAMDALLGLFGLRAASFLRQVAADQAPPPHSASMRGISAKSSRARKPSGPWARAKRFPASPCRDTPQSAA